MSISYGQKSLAPGAPTIYTVAQNTAFAIVQNESPYTLFVTIDGTGSTRSIPAQSVDKVIIPAQGFNGNIILNPVAIIGTATATAFEVILDGYGPYEEPVGVYPVGLARAVQVGGSINVSSSAASSLSNTTGAPSQNIITIQSNTDSGTTFSFTNDGLLKIATTLAGSLTTLLQTQKTGNTLLLGAAGQIAEVLGQFQVDDRVFLNVPSYVTLTGSTSGTATFYMPLQGTFKLLIVSFSNFRNGSAGNQNVSIPTFFTSFAKVFSGGQPALQLLSGGSAQTISLITTWASGGGTTTPVSTLNSASIGETNSGFDTLSLVGSQASSHTGALILFGI